MFRTSSIVKWYADSEFSMKIPMGVLRKEIDLSRVSLFGFVVNLLSFISGFIRVCAFRSFFGNPLRTKDGLFVVWARHLKLVHKDGDCLH